MWIQPAHNKRYTLQFFLFKNIVYSVIHIILFVIKNIYHPAVLMLTVNSFNTFLIKNSIQLKKRWKLFSVQSSPFKS